MTHRHTLICWQTHYSCTNNKRVCRLFRAGISVEARLGFLAVQEAVVPVQQVLVVDVPIVVMHAVGALDVNISSTQPWASECQSVCIPASWICQDECAGLGAQVKAGQSALLARLTGAPCPKAPIPRSCVTLPCSHVAIICAS